MQVEVAWVKPPPQVGGLDHLAVQAPCINIYGRMLPGITNVTDRARYYSFYPWLVWSLDRQGHKKYDDAFIERFRRADCLFCLIAQRHAHVANDGAPEDHAAAMVGSDTLSSVARTISRSDSARLSDYSLREGARARYFASRLGGLGQYYLGVLRELSILDGDAAQGIRYTRQVGQVIAEKMDAGVDGNLFAQIVQRDRFTGKDLDELVSFCPCQLVHNARERELLADLFFARGQFHSEEALPRQRTLQLVLDLAASLRDEEEGVSEWVFKACVYTGALPSNKAWTIPGRLERNRERWAIYARNEIFSLALQGLFFAVLDAYEESALRFASSSEIVEWFVGQPEARKAMAELGAKRPFRDCLKASKAWLPPLARWDRSNHEVQLSEEVARLSHTDRSPENRQAVIAAALKTIVALCSRAPVKGSEYGDFVFEQDYFTYYPVNLRSLGSFAGGAWREMSVRDLLRWLLLNWGLETHLRVALRKLRGQSQSTFKVRPSDRGMEVTAVPPAVHTRPRFNQALRILKDIGALERDESRGWKPSALGRQMLEEAHAS
jgi:hypothetical protein